MSSENAAAVFRLPLRDAVWRGAQGQFTGNGTGNSLDFQDHRQYFPGDDPRHINWQAYARTGNYTMKLFRQEVSPRVDVVIDISASMFFAETKKKRVHELVFFAAESASRLGAALQIFSINDTGATHIPNEKILNKNWTPEIRTTSGKTANPLPVALSQVPFRHGSLRVLISDLLFPVEKNALHTLAAGQGRGVIFAPFCAAEAHPDWDGNHFFEDAETGVKSRQRVTASLLQRHNDAYARHFETWRASATRHGIRLARVNSDTALLTTLRADALPAGAIERCQ